MDTNERLATIEELLRHLCDEQKDQKRQDEKLDGKIDQILTNDKDKLQRITRTETTVKNMKATLYVFFVALVGAVVKTLV